MSKLRASTLACAFSSALLIQGWMIASSSFRPSVPQHAVHALRAENAHQIVFQRQEEARAAGIALAARAAAQLIVDAAALVPLGADHVKAAGRERLSPSSWRPRPAISARFLAICSGAGSLPFSVSAGEPVREQHVGVAAELDVGAAARHVGGDGNRARHAGLRDDPRLLLVIARVQHLMRHLVLLQQAGEDLGFLDRGGADQHRLAALRAPP